MDCEPVGDGLCRIGGKEEESRGRRSGLEDGERGREESTTHNNMAIGEAVSKQGHSRELMASFMGVLENENVRASLEE